MAAPAARKRRETIARMPRCPRVPSATSVATDASRCAMNRYEIRMAESACVFHTDPENATRFHANQNAKPR